MVTHVVTEQLTLSRAPALGMVMTPEPSVTRNVIFHNYAEKQTKWIMPWKARLDKRGASWFEEVSPERRLVRLPWRNVFSSTYIRGERAVVLGEAGTGIVMERLVPLVLAREATWDNITYYILSEVSQTNKTKRVFRWRPGSVGLWVCCCFVIWSCWECYIGKSSLIWQYWQMVCCLCFRITLYLTVSVDVSAQLRGEKCQSV